MRNLSNSMMMSLLFVALMLVIILFSIVRFFRDKENRYQAFFIKNDFLIINNLWLTKYSIYDIELMELSCTYLKNLRRSHYKGLIKLHLKNGKKRVFYFDGGSADNKFTLLSTPENLKASIIHLEQILDKHHIKYTSTFDVN